MQLSPHNYAVKLQRCDGCDTEHEERSVSVLRGRYARVQRRALHTAAVTRLHDGTTDLRFRVCCALQHGCVASRRGKRKGGRASRGRCSDGCSQQRRDARTGRRRWRRAAASAGAQWCEPGEQCWFIPAKFWQ
jgi:hypothetical protein